MIEFLLLLAVYGMVASVLVTVMLTAAIAVTNLLPEPAAVVAKKVALVVCLTAFVGFGWFAKEVAQRQAFGSMASGPAFREAALHVRLMLAFVPGLRWLAPTPREDETSLPE